MLFQIAGVVEAAGEVDFVHVVEEGEGEFSGGVDEVFEVDAFEAAGAGAVDVVDDALFGLIESLGGEEHVLLDTDEAFLFDEQPDCLGDVGHREAQRCGGLFDLRGAKQLLEEEAFDLLEQSLLGGVELFAVGWGGDAVLADDELFVVQQAAQDPFEDRLGEAGLSREGFFFDAGALGLLRVELLDGLQEGLFELFAHGGVHEEVAGQPEHLSGGDVPGEDFGDPGGVLFDADGEVLGRGGVVGGREEAVKDEGVRTQDRIGAALEAFEQVGLGAFDLVGAGFDDHAAADGADRA